MVPKNKTILVDAVHCFLLEGSGIVAEMRTLLDEYPNRKIILTGANDTQMERFGLNNMPYEVFTLKHDPEKNDPKYYTTMLAHFDLRAEDAIYIEHDHGAAKSARSVGIITYSYDAKKMDMQKVKEFLDAHLSFS